MLPTVRSHGTLNFCPRPIPAWHRRQPLQPGDQINNPQVCVAVHCQADGRVPGKHLSDFWWNIGRDQIGDKPVP